MRLILTTGVVLLLSGSLGTPAHASGPLAGGVGQGFTSGLGWALCSGVGKVAVKMGKSITGKNHKSENADADSNRQMGPEDYYNRGMEDGYARAREEMGSSTYEGRYAQRAEAPPKQNVQTRVYAKKLNNTRLAAARPAANRRRSHYVANAQQNKQKTVAASQTINATGSRKVINIADSDKMI